MSAAFIQSDDNTSNGVINFVRVERNCVSNETIRKTGGRLIIDYNVDDRRRAPRDVEILRCVAWL